MWHATRHALFLCCCCSSQVRSATNYQAAGPTAQQLSYQRWDRTVRVCWRVADWHARSCWNLVVVDRHMEYDTAVSVILLLSPHCNTTKPHILAASNRALKHATSDSVAHDHLVRLEHMFRRVASPSASPYQQQQQRSAQQSPPPQQQQLRGAHRLRPGSVTAGLCPWPTGHAASSSELRYVCILCMCVVRTAPDSSCLFVPNPQQASNFLSH